MILSVVNYRVEIVAIIQALSYTKRNNADKYKVSGYQFL